MHLKVYFPIIVISLLVLVIFVIFSKVYMLGTVQSKMFSVFPFSTTPNYVEDTQLYQQ